MCCCPFLITSYPTDMTTSAAVVDTLKWTCKPFAALSLQELYDVLHARCQVFIVEQVAFQDLDGQDQGSWHLQGRDAQGVLQSYARVLPPGLAYPVEGEPSIGRVLVMQAARGTGAGWELMRHAIAEVERMWPGTSIRIGAQAYLQKFYEGCGFVDMDEPYLEDGIPHRIMLRQPA